MALVSWTSQTSGSWATGGNWSTGGAPLNGDDVSILVGSGITVSYAGGLVALNSLVTSGGTFTMSGGYISTAAGYDLGSVLNISAGQMRLSGIETNNYLTGNINQSGGTLTLLNGATAFSAIYNQTGGLLTVGTGIFSDSDNGTLAGTIAGHGELLLNASPGGSITLAKGLDLTVATAELTGQIALSAGLSYAGDFNLASTSSLFLYGNTLTLTGYAALDGVIANGGTAFAAGSGVLNGLTLNNGSELTLAGTYAETGVINIGGTGSGTMSILSGGALRLTSNTVIENGSAAGTLLNAGLLEKIGGSSPNGATTIEAAFSNAVGATLDAAVGTIEFDGPSSDFTSTLAGTITGAGTVGFEAGLYQITNASSLTLTVGRMVLSGSTEMTLTTALIYNGEFVQDGGTLVVGSPGQSTGSLTLGGLTALEGGLLKGTGTVLSTGAVNLSNFGTLDGNLTFNFEGPVNQTGGIYFGLEADAITTANISSGNSWLLKGSATSIYGANGQINNAGTFGKLNGAGDSVVQSALINSGTLVVDSGELTLSGAGTLAGTVTGGTLSNGTMTGGGVLDITGAFAFGGGLNLSVGEVILQANGSLIQASLFGNLTYANNWALEGGTLALDGNGVPNGNTLTLTGTASLQSGAVEGPGEVISTGRAILGQGLSLVQGADLQMNGKTEQTGNVVLTGGSNAPTLAIGPTGTYTMDPGVQLGLAGAPLVGTVTVAGTLIANGVGVFPSPDNVINANLIDNGKIMIGYGEMQFLGSVSGTGGITIFDGATLDINTSSGVTTGVSFGAGGGVLELGSPNAYSGTIAGFAAGDIVELNGFSFLSGTESVNGSTVTISEASGPSVTLTFAAAQTGSLLTLGVGPHGDLALIHI